MQDEQVSHSYFNDYVEDDFELDAQIDNRKNINRREKQKGKGYTSSENQWFDNRILQAAGRKPTEEDDYDEVSNDIELLVHRLNPPFLDVSTVLSNQIEIVSTIRDKTGDLYKYSRSGSFVVNKRREERDRKKNAKETANIDNTSLGKVIKGNMKKNTEDIETGQEEDSDNFIKALNKDNTYSKDTIRMQRMKLPAYQVKDTLLRLISENQVIVIIGETGSGKTTQLPQFLYEAGYHKQGLIGITQPRRVAAMSVAKRVSEEMGVKLSEEVGFTIRFEDHCTEKTKIKFMTDGILLRETLLNDDLDQYSCIIMDEAHERSLNTDILLGLFKSILARRRDLKLIITSATMNAYKFSRFYGNAEQFTIPGRTYPVNIMYSKDSPSDYVANAVKQVLRIHLGKETGDILVFMTGQEDIETTCEEIEKNLTDLMKADDTIEPLEVLPIYSTLPADLQAKVFQKSKIRKCIVATNIAETSLTVDGVKFVIDTGLMKLKVYNPKVGLDSLQITPISQAQSNQRSGRAGRTGPGTCYRLYTLTSFNQEMFPSPIPEIQRTNLSNTILLLKSLKVSDLSKFPFLDKPAIEAINTAQYDLWSIGALDNFGNLTKLGSMMSKLPIDPALSKLLILSTLGKFNCSQEIAIIVSMLSIPPIFVRPTNDANLMKKSESVREKFQVAESDHLTLLNVYNQFSKNKRWASSWCQQNFLHFKSLRKAREIQVQLVQILKTMKLPFVSCGVHTDKKWIDHEVTSNIIVVWNG
ncbi:unnamed protein product [Ambrosiozyma monospora]|uniref:Unnamed protein product n=1 Tax=Ambrosiozyma monospora TaxID=43982 RepID=A0ACB5T3V9_AMBMO|nr:unnamed protein product [Ambrosiozyma monospora]